MLGFIVGAIILIYALWAVTFLITWISNIKIINMISTLEEAVDYSLLKSDLVKEPEPEKEKEIKDKMEVIKERIRKDFDV